MNNRHGLTEKLTDDFYHRVNQVTLERVHYNEALRFHPSFR